MRGLHALLVVGLGALACGVAAAELDQDFQVWGNVTATGTAGTPAASPWRYWLEAQGRFGDDGSRFSQGIVRPGLGYALSERVTAWAGYGWIVSDGGRAADVIEHRVWQQLTWRPAQPYAGIDVASRTRLEQRFSEQGGGSGWRLRQFLRLSRPLGASTLWSAIAYDELMVNLNRTRWGAAEGIDQNRAFAGVGVQVAEHARLEAGYLNQYIVRDGAADRMHHVLALSLFLNL